MSATEGRREASAGGSWAAGLLDLHCPNCGTRTARTLLLDCVKCGYPTRTRIKCPNCGRVTYRRRWACEWCHHPLPAEVQPNAQPAPATISKQEPPLAPVEPAGAPTVSAIIEVPAPPPAGVSPPVQTAPETTAAPPVAVPHVSTAAEPAAVPPVIAMPSARIKRPPATDEYVTVTVEEMSTAFTADPSAADKTYTDSLLRVSGIVEQTAPGDELTGPAVLLSGGDSAAKWVHCSFDAKYAALVKRLTPGQHIAVLGRYAGHDDHIRLADCLPVG